MIDIEFTLSPRQEAQLRQELKRNGSVCVYRRAVALLAVHKGNAVTEVADLLGVTRQTIYNWIDTYGSASNNFDLEDAERPGRPSIWTPELQASLGRALEQAPEQFGHEASEWTVSVLRKHLATETGRRISETALRQKLQAMGYVQKRHRYVIRPSRPQQIPQPEVQELSWRLAPQPLATEPARNDVHLPDRSLAVPHPASQ